MLNVASHSFKHAGCPQRVKVELEPFRPEECKIRIEQFDAKLGWYTAGSLRVPLDQLPDLQEALAKVQAAQARAAEDHSKVIPVSFR